MPLSGSLSQFLEAPLKDDGNPASAMNHLVPFKLVLDRRVCGKDVSIRPSVLLNDQVRNVSFPECPCSWLT